jgi:hypothetical protein
MKRLQWSLWILVIIWLLVMLVSTEAGAGEIRLSWSPSPGGPPATGYRVYTGIAPGDYAEVDVGGVMFHFFAALPDCQTNYFAVKAYNEADESEFSYEVSVYPRPSITDITSSQAGTHTILGNNFAPNARVYVNSTGNFLEVPPEDVEWLTCGELRIPDIPVLQVKVANTALPTGSGEPLNIFSMPWPGPVNLQVE